MFRAALVVLAKKKPVAPVPRKKVLKRLTRGTSKGGRGGSVKRRGVAGVHPTAAAAGGRGDPVGGRDGSSGNGSGGVDGNSLVHVSSEEGRTPAASAASGHVPSRAMTYRLATAVSTVVVPPLANAYLESMKQTLTPAVQRPQDGGFAEAAPVSQMEEYYTSKKGPLFATAVIAGTNAVKQASMLIPFCHPIPIQKCSFTFRRRAVGSSLSHSALPHRVVLRKRSSVPSPRPSRPEYSVLYCFCTVATEEYKTGVEMEALTGATVAAMTLYDMLKGLPGAQEDGLSLGESFVLAKRGGKNDFIKLLMSEPDRPAEPSKVSPALTEGSGANAMAPSTTSATDAGRDAEAEEEAEEAEESEAAAAAKPTAARQHEDDSKLRGRVVKKTSSTVTPAAAEAMEEGPGDSGAWWRSSRHEKKLQELYPRRKYGDGARLAPQPTSAELKTKGRAATTTATAAAAASPVTPAARTVAKEQDGDADDNEEEEEEAEVASAATRGRTHAKGPPPAAALPKPKAKAVAKARAATAEEPEEAEGDEDAEEESARRKKHRSGQLAKKTARAPAQRSESGEEDVDEDEVEEAEDGEADERVAHRAAAAAKKTAKKRQTALKGKRAVSKAAAARARAAEADAEADDDDERASTPDEDEVEEEPAASPVHRKKPATKGKPATRHQPRRSLEYDEREDDEDEGADADEDEDEDEEVVALGRDGRVRPVRHDSWDNQTVVEDEAGDDEDAVAEEEEEEEAPPPPPPPKTLKKGKKVLRRT